MVRDNETSGQALQEGRGRITAPRGEACKALARPGMRAILYHTSIHGGGADGSPGMIEAVYPNHCVFRDDENGMLYAGAWDDVQLLGVVPDPAVIAPKPMKLPESAETITLSVGPRSWTIIPRRGGLDGFSFANGIAVDGDRIYVNEDADDEDLSFMLADIIAVGIAAAASDDKGGE